MFEFTYMVIDRLVVECTHKVAYIHISYICCIPLVSVCFVSSMFEIVWPRRYKMQPIKCKSPHKHTQPYHMGCPRWFDAMHTHTQYSHIESPSAPFRTHRTTLCAHLWLIILYDDGSLSSSPPSTSSTLLKSSSHPERPKYNIHSLECDWNGNDTSTYYIV